MKPSEFGSVEWAEQEKKMWRDRRRTAWITFWLTWMWLCVLAWFIAHTPMNKAALLLDGAAVAIALVSIKGSYSLIQQTEEMMKRVDQIRSKLRAHGYR